MRPFIRATPSPIPCRYALAAGFFVCMALTGCDEVDPLEAIRQQQAAGDYRGSVEPLRELLATRADDAETNYRYGLALMLTQRSNLAVWSFRKAMKDPEWFVLAGSKLAHSALEAADFNEVVEITTGILEREPENLLALLMRANAHAHWKKDPELALEDANRALELNPDALEAYEPRILALLSLARLEEASEALAEAGRRLVAHGEEKANPDILAWHCSTTAAFEQESGDLEQARQTWIECLEAHPIRRVVVTNALNFYDGLGEGDRSLEVLRAALAGAPAVRSYRVMLAQRLRSSGHSAEAEAVLREATRSENPMVAIAAWFDLGKLRQAYGEHDAAAEAIERALEIAHEANSAEAQLPFEYADALVLAGRLGQALEVAEDLPVPAHRHLIRGRVAQEQRNPARALEEYDAALLLWPDNAWARYYAALAAEELGDFDRALAEYRYSVRISPAATDARTRGADLLLAVRQPGAALQMLRTGAREAPLEIEGQLLLLRLSGLQGNMTSLANTLTLIETARPTWAGQALAAAAEGLAQRAGSAMAMSVITTAPGINFNDVRFAAALRARVRLSHEAGDTAATEAALHSVLAAHPATGVFQEIHGLHLELSGAPEEAVRAAYTRALEISPRNAGALTGLGRLALRDDPQAAVVFFDRAAAADPSDPGPKLQAAKALIASRELDLAAERLDRLLIEHPFEAEAAAERVRLDLEQGIATPRTLERARRAVRITGRAYELELLSRVHDQRDESEPAARAAERARALREAEETTG